MAPSAVIGAVAVGDRCWCWKLRPHRVGKNAPDSVSVPPIKFAQVTGRASDLSVFIVKPTKLVAPGELLPETAEILPGPAPVLSSWCDLLKLD
jgi:hypothetical protein